MIFIKVEFLRFGYGSGRLKYVNYREMNFGDSPPTRAEQLVRNLKITLLECRSLDLGPGWRLDLCSPFYRLYVNNRPGAWIIHQGRKLPLGAGEYWVIPAWVRFQTGVTGRVRQDYLHFDVKGLSFELFQRIFDSPLSLKSPAVLRELARQGKKQKEVPRLCWALALAQAGFACALSTALDRYEGDPSPWRETSAGIEKALELLQTRLESPPSNAELAALVGSSEDHFVRRFRLATGSTPGEFGRAHRVSTAAEWLVTTNRTLEDIAEATGFTDRFHLSRVFKSRFGQPPVAYRNMHRREFGQ